LPEPQCVAGTLDCACWSGAVDYVCCDPSAPGGVVTVPDPEQCPSQLPPDAPKIVAGKWVPFLRGATNCCDYDGTPDVDEGLADGWALVTEAALDRIVASGTVNWTHVRLGPFREPADISATLNRTLARSIRGYGPGPAILDDARASGLAAKARGVFVEWDVVDNWALVHSEWNFYGDNCSVTHAAPPARYLEWASAVVGATWDIPGTYNLGNEGFRCAPSEAWERGLYDALKAALAAKGVSRAVGSTVTINDKRTSFDYRTFHGWTVPPSGWSTDIPAMLTETDNDHYDAAAWTAFAGQMEARGMYVSIWRGPVSWSSHNASIAAMPKLGAPPSSQCTLPLDGQPIMDIANHPEGSRNYDATPKIRNAARCDAVGFPPGRQACPVCPEGCEQRQVCEQELIGGVSPVWQMQNATGTLRIELEGDWFGRLYGEGTGEIRACYPNGAVCSAWLGVEEP
jgi:hypothetical protein